MSREDSELEGITLLGDAHTHYPDQYAPEVLETFKNKHPENEYLVTFNCPEFTSLCPRTAGLRKNRNPVYTGRRYGGKKKPEIVSVFVPKPRRLP